MKNTLDEILEIDLELNPVWKMRPPIVGSAGLNHCWAACISSWSRATDSIPNMTVNQVIERVRIRFPSKVAPDGTLIGEQGLDALRDVFGITWEKMPSANLTLSNLGNRLRRSYIIIVFLISPADTIWHSVLVYGIDRGSICHMDPLMEERNCEKQNNFSVSSSVVYVLWKP